MSDPIEHIQKQSFRYYYEDGLAELAVVTILDAVDKADFLYLQRATGLTKGNLSVHLQKLEEAGLIEIQKTFQGKYPRTVCKLTPIGKEGFEVYKEQLKGVLGR